MRAAVADGSLAAEDEGRCRAARMPFDRHSADALNGRWQCEPAVAACRRHAEHDYAAGSEEWAASAEGAHCLSQFAEASPKLGTVVGLN